MNLFSGATSADNVDIYAVNPRICSPLDAPTNFFGLQRAPPPATSCTNSHLFDDEHSGGHVQNECKKLCATCDLKGTRCNSLETRTFTYIMKQFQSNLIWPEEFQCSQRSDLFGFRSSERERPTVERPLKSRVLLCIIRARRASDLLSKGADTVYPFQLRGKCKHFPAERAREPNRR